MKKIPTVLLCAVFILSTALTTVFATDKKISPAIDVIASGSPMIKSGISGKSVCFTKDDFEHFAGRLPSSIRFSSLPSAADGILKIGNTEISEGQTVTGTNLDLLRFIPNDGTDNARFRFICEGGYSAECIIKLTDSENASPTASENGISVSTQADVSCYGSLSGNDADGDKLTFEIVSYPEAGIAEICDSSNGTFRYTPYDGALGADSFSYRVRDEYGNYSDECEVTVMTEPKTIDVDIADMEDHWGYNAALSVIADGTMNVISENGSLYFDPDEYITREEYLKTVMIALGAGKLSPRHTVYSDNAEIADECSGYVSSASRLGIIYGDGKCFRPKEAISRAEASVILNRILGLKSDAKSVFSDTDEIPDWAAESVSALSEAGIISGIGNCFYPSDGLTRAEAAQILLEVKKLF